MESNQFWQELSEKISLPFEIEEVDSLDENCGTLWIELKNGLSFFITIEHCEEIETE